MAEWLSNEYRQKTDNGLYRFETRSERLTRERRFKIVGVGQDRVFEMFAWGMAENLPQFVSVPRFKDLPRDIVIGPSVKTSLHDQAFEFQVFHESFEPVEYGNHAPRVWAEFESHEVAVKSEQWNKISGCVNVSTLGVTSTLTLPADDENLTCHEEPVAQYTQPLNRKFSLKMVAFGDAPLGTVFFESSSPTKLLRCIKLASGWAATVGVDNSIGPDFYFPTGANIFVKADDPNDPLLPFYYDNGQLKSRYESAFKVSPVMSGQKTINNTSEGEWTSDELRKPLPPQSYLKETTYSDVRQGRNFYCVCPDGVVAQWSKISDRYTAFFDEKSTPSVRYVLDCWKSDSVVLVNTQDDFSRAAEIESNTPITVGPDLISCIQNGVPHKLAMRVVGFGDIEVGDHFYTPVCFGKDIDVRECVKKSGNMNAEVIDGSSYEFHIADTMDVFVAAVTPITVGVKTVVNEPAVVEESKPIKFREWL